MSWRLPRKLSFPGGYEVTILVVDRGEMDGDHGEWDAEAQTVKIAQDLSPAEKRGILVLHEWDHITTDWKLWLAQKVSMKLPEGMEPDPTEVEEEDGQTTN